MKNKKNKSFFVSIVVPIIGYKTIPSYLCKSLLTLFYPKNRIEILFVKLHSQKITLPPLGIRTMFVNSKRLIGYSEALNLGARNAKGELIFLINPDIRLDKNVLLRLVEYFYKGTTTGVVGPVVFQLRKPKKISPYDLPVLFKKNFGKMTPFSPEQIKKIKSPYEVDWLSGCALMFSKNTWMRLGGFEEKFFIYWEDADFCMRAKEKGRRVVIVPDAKVWHEGSVYMRSQNFKKVYYLVRNGKYFTQRHAGFLGVIFLHFNNALIMTSKIMQLILIPNSRLESTAVLSGIIDFYRGKRGMR